MKTSSVFATSLALLALLVTGCTGASPAVNSEAQHGGHADQNSKVEREANFSKLPAEDRPLAEAQGYCAVTAEPLGSMGAPLKIMIDDHAVFLCCQGCEQTAKSNPQQTLAKVEELRGKVKSEQTHNQTR